MQEATIELSRLDLELFARQLIQDADAQFGAAFVNLLHQIYEQGSGHAAPNQSVFQVLRCVHLSASSSILPASPCQRVEFCFY
jgi:hypothetical protein